MQTTEVVQLAASPLQLLINAAYAQSSELTSELDPLRSAAEAAWTRASTITSKHLFIVIRNSLSRSGPDLLKRPDVRDVLRIPFTDAATATSRAVQDAWDRGIELGVKAANADLKLMGIDPVDVGDISIGRSVLERLFGDVSDNATRTTKLLTEKALTPGDPDLTRDLVTHRSKGSAWRAGLSVDAAGTYAHAAAKEAVYLKAQEASGLVIWKVWVTRFGPGTCPTCAKLHGTRRRLGEPFPADVRFAGPRLATLDRTLGHPPRHPNCRCRIVMWVTMMETKTGPSLATMLEFARKWWARVTRKRAV